MDPGAFKQLRGSIGAKGKMSAPAPMSSSTARTRCKREADMRKPPLSDDIEAALQAPPEPAAVFLRNQTHPIGADLEGELMNLERLSVDDLRLHWRNHWGPLAPAHLSRGLLLRVMAYRLQAEAFGDLDRKTARMLERLADGAADESASNRSSTPNSDERLKPGASSARAARDPLILKPGALLVREWQGRLERVTVVTDGFEWNGASYTSLSAAAFAITGKVERPQVLRLTASRPHSGEQARG
jgi:hypothetical protein